MAAGLEMLSVRRVNAITQTFNEKRDQPGDLIFSSRIPDVPSTDGEILAEFQGMVHVADIIADDQRAVVKSGGKFSLSIDKIPNIKLGIPVLQETINLLQRIDAGGGIPSDEGIIRNYRNRLLDDVRAGVQRRKEIIAVAMVLDLGEYDRFGIKFSGVSFGMPPDLKIVLGAPLTDRQNCKFWSQLLALKDHAQGKYGEQYNRVSLPTEVFRLAVALDEFRDLAQLYSTIRIPNGAFPLTDLRTAQTIAENFTGLTIEFCDKRYDLEEENATVPKVPYFPPDMVALSNTADDNNPSQMKFANGITTESVVASQDEAAARNGVIGRFAGPAYGPVSYVTLPPDLNPPNYVCWGVARGWYKKRRKTATARMRVTF